MLSHGARMLTHSNDPDQLAILAGLPQNETVFEYLTGCWRRLYIANRETHRVVRSSRASGLIVQAYPANEKATWAKTFEAVKALIISYCGLTLEDSSMFPQPTGYVRPRFENATDDHAANPLDLRSSCQYCSPKLPYLQVHPTL